MGKRPKKANDVAVTLGFFDSRWNEDALRVKFHNVPIQDVEPLGFNDYAPSGGTPLNDAVLKFIGALDKVSNESPNAVHIGLLGDESGSMGHLRSDVVEGFNTFIDEVRNDDSKGGDAGVLVVIMTDGLENSSKEDPQGDKVRKAVADKEAEGWNFFYLGANQDAWTAGQNLNLGSTSHSLNYEATSSGMRGAMTTMANVANTKKSSDAATYLTTTDTLAARNTSGTSNVTLWVPDVDKTEDKADEDVDK